MSWLALLFIALFLTLIAALTGIKPKGTRPVAGTRLMGMARVILFLTAGVFLLLAVRGWVGG